MINISDLDNNQSNPGLDGEQGAPMGGGHTGSSVVQCGDVVHLTPRQRSSAFSAAVLGHVDQSEVPAGEQHLSSLRP